MKQDENATHDVSRVVGIAWYRADQWARLHEVSVDRAELEPSYTSWEAGANRRLQELRARCRGSTWMWKRSSAGANWRAARSTVGLGPGMWRRGFVRGIRGSEVRRASNPCLNPAARPGRGLRTALAGRARSDA